MWTLTDKQLAMIKRAAALLPSLALPVFSAASVDGTAVRRHIGGACMASELNAAVASRTKVT